MCVCVQAVGGGKGGKGEAITAYLSFSSGFFSLFIQKLSGSVFNRCVIVILFRKRHFNTRPTGLIIGLTSQINLCVCVYCKRVCVCVLPGLLFKVIIYVISCFTDNTDCL